MKLKNILISLFVIILSLFTITVKAESSVPQAVNFAGNTAKSLKGSEYLGYGSTLNFSYKVTTDGKVAYCTEIHDDWFYSGYESFYLVGKTSDKYAYIMANGYPTKSITGDNYKDYYITGLAIWYIINPNDVSFTYFDLSKGTYKGHPSVVVSEVAKLVYGANNYVAPKTSIKINSASEFTLSSDKNYYISTVNVDSSNLTGNYTVRITGAPEGSVLTDINGNVSSSFSGSSFLVKVPVKSIKALSYAMTLSVSGSGIIYNAYQYNPTARKNNLQNVALLYPETVNVNSSTSLYLNIATKVEISKIDATNNKELPGATLVLKDANEKQIDKWVSEGTPHKIEGLKPGKYTLTEINAPEGYVLSTETVTFEIKADGTVAKATMKNYPEKPKTTYISKIDATTGKELPGATLVLKDASGKQIDKWVSKSTTHKIEGLKPGKYTLTETIAPDGYKLSTETVTFTVEKDGTVKEKVVMKNYPDTYVEISKQDATTGEELPGATLVLKDAKGKQVDKWVSESTPHKVKNLKPGKYTLTETIAPEGYVLSTETVTFTVKEDGTVKGKVVMKNYPKEPETIYISKQDITTGEELAGAYLEIKNSDGVVVEAWISETTPHKVQGLEPGKYTLTETIAPEGYELSKEVITFTVKEDGTTDGTVVMYNKPEEIEVPSTASFKTITASLIGIVIIGLGSLIIYKNYKKNEEN